MRNDSPMRTAADLEGKRLPGTRGITDQPAFAFEAENARAAALLVQTPRFARAFDDFGAKRGKAWTARAVVSARAATGAEAAR